MKKLFPSVSSVVKSLPVLFLAFWMLAAQAADSDRWTKTIERVSTGIVTIRVDATRPFDTENNFSSQATGFVVDAKRGIILTNRHVVQPGPVVAEAIFLNKEEVELKPVYRDPVHDFGFYQYDPSSLRYLRPAELPLAPERATVGREIRVIGNDAGEQLSILAGTLARLDREAPAYGRGNYNDFNTFYIQAASGASGGSSGSPVIDVEGRVVALNAGARMDASSSYFLPLDRIMRALKLLQAGRPVTRGTLQTVFVHKPFDELHRLGLQRATETAVRSAFPGQTGMLVVDQVIPDGPADGALRPGDILTHVNGELLTHFISLEAVLDGAVNQPVKLQGERGGTPFSAELKVRDLHAITPDRYLEISGAVLHDLSYQMARHLNNPVKGVFIAHTGYMFAVAGVPRGAVITEFDGQRITELSQLRDALEALPDGTRVSMRFYTFDQPRRETLALLEIDRRWFPARICERNDAAGVWPCDMLTAAPADGNLEPGTAIFPEYKDPRARRLARSLVFINFDMPYPVDGVDGAHYYGSGLIVDTEKGLVVVDRNTVPVGMGDVRLTFAGSLEIPGHVVYVHPLHNLAVVSYDPALIGDTQVAEAELRLEELSSGDDVWLVGLQADQTLAVQRSEIGSIDPAQFPLSNTFRFRDTNIELISLVNAPDGVDGVLADAQGRVVALWSSFAYQAGRGLNQTSRGLPAAPVAEMVDLVQRNGARELRSLEAEFYLMPLASARKLGLPEGWVRKLEKLNPRQRQALAIERLVSGTPARELLREGDLLLALDGRVVNDFRGVERAAQKPVVAVTLFRGGEVIEVEVPTVALDGRSTGRALAWAGALLQEPHRAIAAQRGIPREGVFTAYFNYGSPASHYGLYPGRRIIEVDGKPTPDLNAFFAVVQNKQDREAVRLTTVNWDDRVEVITLKLDLRYFPTYELRLTENGWQRIDY